MFLKIVIILLGLFFLVDNTVALCGQCQTENHVACLSEDTFSLCVEGKSTNSVIHCPKDTVCTEDPAICVSKDNDALIRSCVAGRFSIETGNFNETQDAVRSDSSTLIPDSTAGETTIITDIPSTTAEDGSSHSTNYSDTTTIDPTVPGVSNSENSKTTDESTTTYSEEGEISSSTTEDSETSAHTTVIAGEISSTTTDLSTTELPTSSSSQDITSSDISTTEIDISTSAPRDATTFCSEIKDVGTFRVKGDTSCKRYYVCTTYKDGFKGYEFSCGENYFNAEISLCQKEKPDDC